MSGTVLFLRLEGPLQAWGDHLSKFVFRQVFPFPSKSGVLGLLCAAMGIRRDEARDVWLPALNRLLMAVRVDRAGIPFFDYHTVGAGLGNLQAEGKLKKTASTGELETFVTYREYLADASFLVALLDRGDTGLPCSLHDAAEALRAPKWPLYLGRKACVPARPIVEPATPDGPQTNPLEAWSEGLLQALQRVAYRPSARDRDRRVLDCFVEWERGRDGAVAPDDAIVLYDVPVSFSPPVHRPRYVLHKTLCVGRDVVTVSWDAAESSGPRLEGRKRADYTDSAYRRARQSRLIADRGLCVFCKAPATDVHHVSYERAGGEEIPEDLRSLCRICHDAITMLEYGAGLGPDRIDPCDPAWRLPILEKRQAILRWRSLEKRRRRLATTSPEEVE